VKASGELLERIASEAVSALLFEAAAAPKPGLVTPFSKGAHRDMDYFLFLRSGAALAPYFASFVRIGAALAGKVPEDTLSPLRAEGLRAEKAMSDATGGVNTHKGLIFSLGILCAAAGRIAVRGAEPGAAGPQGGAPDSAAACPGADAAAGPQGGAPDSAAACPGADAAAGPQGGALFGAAALARTAASICRGICARDFAALAAQRAAPADCLPHRAESADSAAAALPPQPGLSAGDMLYLRYGTKGIRAEVEAGFPSVLVHSLPRLKKDRASGLSMNDALVDALISLFPAVEDSNVLNRAGPGGLALLKSGGREVLEAGGMSAPGGREAIAALDRRFIDAGISPGGCADLLADTVFLWKLEALGAPAAKPSCT